MKSLTSQYFISWDTKSFIVRNFIRSHILKERNNNLFYSLRWKYLIEDHESVKEATKINYTYVSWYTFRNVNFGDTFYATEISQKDTSQWMPHATFLISNMSPLVQKQKILYKKSWLDCARETRFFFIFSPYLKNVTKLFLKMSESGFSFA